MGISEKEKRTIFQKLQLCDDKYSVLFKPYCGIQKYIFVHENKTLT
jgi:hypothetical protein